MIILLPLNSFLIIFLLRIYSRGIPSSVARLKMSFTHGLQFLLPSHLLLLVLVKERLCLVGMIVSAIHIHMLFVKFSSLIICLCRPIKVSTSFAYLVKWPRATNYLFRLVLLSISSLWNFFIQICWVLPYFFNQWT